MSVIGQPIVIANSNYHVAQERAWRAAEEHGFVQEEGLERYVYQPGGLLPGRWEFDALSQQMWERGVDIATAVDVRAAIVQRARGEDVYIVGGWRTQLETQLIAAKNITRPEQLRGVRGAGSGGRDNLGLFGITWALRRSGIDPQKDIDWLPTPRVRTRRDSEAGDVLRSGEVSVLAISGQEREAERLRGEGYPVVLDTEQFYKTYYKGLGAWPPGKVIIATKRMIEERGDELRAFLRTNLRGFWFAQDPDNHLYMHDLETRMRQQTFNESERRIRMITSEAPPPRPVGLRTMGFMVMDGLVPRGAVADIIADMVEYGDLDHGVAVDDVVKDAASTDACNELLGNGRISREAVEEWRAINS